MEDAEYAVVIIGSAAGTCKAAVDEIRNTTGKRVGLIKIRVFRRAAGVPVGDQPHGRVAKPGADKR